MDSDYCWRNTDSGNSIVKFFEITEYEVGPIEVGEDEGGADDSPDDAGAPGKCNGNDKEGIVHVPM